MKIINLEDLKYKEMKTEEEVANWLKKFPKGCVFRIFGDYSTGKVFLKLKKLPKQALQETTKG